MSENDSLNHSDQPGSTPDGHSASEPQPEQRTALPDAGVAPLRAAALVAGAVVLVLVTAGATTLFDRAMSNTALARETTAEAIPTVSVLHPTAEKPDVELTLPGSLEAYKESSIYARTSGYLLRWTKDIGSPVKKGELLAVIDTPEVDQELIQARATRQQIAAQMELARISTVRWANLRKSDSVSAQEADQQLSSYKQAQASLAAADANIRRLEQMVSFKRVYAPFSGVLTRRNVDPGALITAGAAGQPLFDLAQVDTLRVFVNVPQAYAGYIKPGLQATIRLQEFPGQSFVGTVARSAESLDPATRTLRTEVDVPNPGGRLLPGAFAQVSFSVGADVQRMTVPVNAMLFRSQGAQVAVVGPDKRVQLRPLVIGRDYGNTLEVLGGLGLNDLIVVNPPDSLEQGQMVNTAQMVIAPSTPGTNANPPSAPPQPSKPTGKGKVS